MNDDLKAYVDGELPPDVAERLRLTLEADPTLRAEADALRSLSSALHRLPQPEPVGRAATLAALSARRPLWRTWTPALAGCAAVLLVASGLNAREAGPVRPVDHPIPGPVLAPTQETTIPEARRGAFERYVRSLGGQVRRDPSVENGDGLRAFYPQAAHEALKRRFLLPDDLPWPTDGLRVRLAR